MNPTPHTPGAGFSAKAVFDFLFVSPWPWWAAGIGLGLTLLAFVWYTGRKMGVSAGYADVCKKMDPKVARLFPPVKEWRFWLLAGLPLGGLVATLGWWSWTWTLGRLDALTLGHFFLKMILLIVGGACLGFGARWARGCVVTHTLMGVPSGSRFSLATTVAFLVAGMLMAQILLKVF